MYILLSAAVIICTPQTATYTENRLKACAAGKKYPPPPKSAVYLASSSTHVYALGAHKNDCQVYVLDGNIWQEVSGASGKAGDTDETKKIVIFDNGVIGSGRQIGERRVGKECRSRWSPYH